MNKVNKLIKKSNVFNFRFEAGGVKPNNKSVASALAPAKVKLMDFCTKVNNDPEILTYKGKTVQVRVTVSPDGSFKYECRGQPTTDLIKEAAGIEKGSATAGRSECGKITKEQLEKIATISGKFFTTDDPEKQLLILQGTVKSMGITVVK